MADDALEIEQDETHEIDDEQEDGPAEVVLDGEEEAQPGADDSNESAVIRDFRKREREKDKRIRDLEQAQGQQQTVLPADPGPRPTLEAFEWDEEKHGAALDKWIDDKAAHDSAIRAQQEQAQELEQSRRQAYQAAKTAQPIAGIDEAEKRVFDQVPEMMRNALLHAKSPALVAALDRYPDRLTAIADTMQRDPAEALMMIGELRGKAKIVPKTRRAPDPEVIATGTASIRSTDKRLEQLEREAARTNDRTAVQAYKRSLRQKAE